MNAERTYLPSMEPETQRRDAPWRLVRPSSIAQYADGRERFEGRKGDVLRWLAAFYNRFQAWPTATELGAWLRRKPRYARRCPDCFALHIRKGVSALIKAGVVVSNGTRACRVTGHWVESWRVVPVGRVR